MKIIVFNLSVLIEFRNKTGRNPSYLKRDEDIALLKSIKEEVFKLYEVNNDKIKDDIFDLVFEELAPICAIVGGTIAQEVIKAVSHKEVPINNMFLLDPYTYNGKEEIVGA